MKIIVLLILFCTQLVGQSDQVLVFSKTKGWRHSSITIGVKTIVELGRANDFEVVATEDGSLFTDDSLANYKAVVFLNTTGDVLSRDEEVAFERYIQNGGGFVGIHSATDTEHEWSWYGSLVGGYFVSHPKICEATLKVTNKNHLATAHLPDEWTRTDEWYNFSNLNSDATVLMTLDEASYEGGENGKYHPIAWCHNYDGGRAFYTGLGHTLESWSEPLFRRQVLGGVFYAMDRKKISNNIFDKK